MSLKIPWWIGLVLALFVVGLWVWLVLKHPEVAKGKGWIAALLAGLLGGSSAGSWLSSDDDDPGAGAEHAGGDDPQPVGTTPEGPSYEDNVDQLPDPDDGHGGGSLPIDSLNAIDGAADGD